MFSSMLLIADQRQHCIHKLVVYHAVVPFGRSSTRSVEDLAGSLGIDGSDATYTVKPPVFSGCQAGNYASCVLHCTIEL